MTKVLAVLFLLFAHQAVAAEWVYEFELDYTVPTYNDRLLSTACTKVVPVQFVQWYAVDPRPGWEVSCGNEQPFYQHFLGMRCWQPLPRFSMECGWRHFSSPRDNHEISYDAFAIRGRFEFGRSKR